jgi:hypothetical protein
MSNAIGFRLAAVALLATLGAFGLNAQVGAITLAGALPVGAGNVVQGTNDHLCVTFSLTYTAASGDTTFTGLNFSDTGTRTATDYSRYRLYEGNAQTGLTLLASSNSPDTLFTGFSHTLTANQQYFFAITVDIESNATVGNTLQVSVTPAGFTAGATVIGQAQTGGIQTIVAASGPVMEVSRDSTVIPSGMSSDDDVGNVPVTGQTFVYTISNKGVDDLVMPADPVSATPMNNVSVTVTQPQDLTVTGGNSTTFSLFIEPSGTGPFLLGVGIANNSNTDPYIFSVSGEGVVSGVADLVIVVQPMDGTGGLPLSQTPVVEARDASDNLDTSFNGQVTASIASGGHASATVLNATVTAVDGVADFSDLAIDLVGTNYTLEFSAAGLTSAPSDPFDITVGPVAQIVIMTQPPAVALGGETWATQPSLQTRDAGGNHAVNDNSTSVDVSLIGGTSGATLLGTHTAVAAGGNVDFTDLGIDLVGTDYQLEFTTTIDGSPVTLTSAEIEIQVGPAAGIVIHQQPANAEVNQPFSVPAILHIVDAGGNHVDTDNSTSVTATLVAGPGGAVLDGTNPVTAVDGVVEFDDLTIDTVGTGYVLEFSSALGTVESDPFNVAGSPALLAVRDQPGRAAEGMAMLDWPVIEIQDAQGSLVVSDNTTEVEVTIESGVGTLSGTTIVQAVNGVVTFDDLIADVGQLGLVLRFSDVTNTPELDFAVSDPFDVVGAPHEMVVVVQPEDVAADETFPVAPVVEIRDENGLLVFYDDSTEVSVEIVDGTGAANAVLSGTLQVTAEGGVVEFDDLSVDLPGTAYRLVFRDAGTTLDEVESDEFNVTGPPPTSGRKKKDDGCSTSEGNGLTLVVLLLAVMLAAGARAVRRA